MGYYFFLIDFCTAAWCIAMDESVAKAFIYVYDYAVVRFRKWKWWLLNNPKNPIVRYFITRRSNKMAEELLRQIQEGEAFKIEAKKHYGVEDESKEES